jgi:hypothetical protein
MESLSLWDSLRDQVRNAAVGDIEWNVLIWFIKRLYLLGNRDVCKMKPVKWLLPL